MSVESSVLPSAHSFEQKEPKQASKIILHSALQKANIAVQCDSINDIVGAIQAYREAVELLDKVLTLIDKESDKKRLQEIHDSYSDRIRLLAAEIEDDDDEDDWLVNHTLQKAIVRKIGSVEFRNNEIVEPFVKQASKNVAKQTERQTGIEKVDSLADNGWQLHTEEKKEGKAIETKRAPSLKLSSFKKEESSVKSIRLRASSEFKIPRTSSLSTIDTVSDDQPKTQQPNRLLGSIRKKAANRLSVEGLVNRKSATYVPSNDGPLFGHFIKDQTKNLDEIKGHHNLELILAIEKSMQQGAYITKNLYIPKSLWQQTNVKLPHVDFKVSACNTIISDVSRLESWTSMGNLESSLKLIDSIGASIEKLKKNFSKKLRGENPKKNTESSSQISNDNQSLNHTNTKPEGGRKTSQSFISWGSKLTKSVERINAFGLSKGEDGYRNYIESLEKLFRKLHVLESWLDYYEEEKRRTNDYQYDKIIMRINIVCNGIDTVVGGFVIRDVTILLAKWLKRGSSWVTE
ncbi:hypothetical protein BY458DRAFT_558972 [Sporodiniella umbellata]|nr:hypothetical protein BY458DRAFT_558972 [Sporodiniella umbellata]